MFLLKNTLSLNWLFPYIKVVPDFIVTLFYHFYIIYVIMEFPDLGKRCTAPACNLYGKIPLVVHMFKQKK